MFMFYNVIASSVLIKTLMSKSETLLLIVLLSRRAVRDLINSVSRVIIRKINEN